MEEASRTGTSVLGGNHDLRQRCVLAVASSRLYVVARVRNIIFCVQGCHSSLGSDQRNDHQIGSARCHCYLMLHVLWCSCGAHSGVGDIGSRQPPLGSGNSCPLRMVAL